MKIFGIELKPTGTEGQWAGSHHGSEYLTIVLTTGQHGLSLGVNALQTTHSADVSSLERAESEWLASAKKHAPVLRNRVVDVWNAQRTGEENAQSK